MQGIHPLPLKGVRVVEFAHVIAGPYVGLLLMMMGAQIVKVEAPGNSDLLKRLPHGQHSYKALNQGKEILALDLNQESERQRAWDLAVDADVVIDSYAPGSLARKGLDYRRLAEANPGLIFCAVSGFGTQDLSWGGRGAYDHVVQAMSGMAMLNGRDGEPPHKVGFPLNDAATGLAAQSAVLAALLERARTGRGQFIDVSIARVALQLLFPMAIDCAVTGNDPPRIGNRGYTGSPGAAFFQCREGFLALGANTRDQLQRAMTALGCPQPATIDDAAGDPTSLLSQLESALAQVSAREAERLLCNADVPAAAVRTLTQFLHDGTACGWLEDHSDQANRWASELGMGWRSYQLPTQEEGKT